MKRMRERDWLTEKRCGTNRIKDSDDNDNFRDSDDVKVSAHVFIISSLESGPAIIGFLWSFITAYIRCLLLRVRAHSAMKAVDPHLIAA